MMDNLKNILESLLFVADEPLAVDRLKKIIPEVETRDIRQAMSDLATDYDDRNTSFYLDEVAGGYQLRTRPAYTEWIQRLVQPKPSRLSRAALETLAIIAYKQPVLRADIEHIRGVDSGGVLRLLMERKLVRILGRKEIPGRPLIYATTKLFLEVFGLKDLKELPTPEEIESLGADENESSDTPQETEAPDAEKPELKNPDTMPSDSNDLSGEGSTPDNTEIDSQDIPLKNENTQNGNPPGKSPVEQDEPPSNATPLPDSEEAESLGPSANDSGDLAEKPLDAETSEDYKNDEQPEMGG